MPRVVRRLLRRRHLFVVVIAAELLAIGIRGTYASYTAQTTNSASTVATGTLALSTTAGTVTCASSSGTTALDNVNSGCGTLSIPAGPWYPGQSTSVSVKVTNTGSLGAGDLSLYMPTCTPSIFTTANFVPSLCGGVAFTVEELNASGSPIACFYPATAAAACTSEPTDYTSTYQIPGPGTLTYFYYDYPNVDARLPLGALAGGQSRTFLLGFTVIPASTPSIGNYYQGQTGTIGLTFHLDQQSFPGDATAP